MTCDAKYDPLKAELKKRGFTPNDGALLKLKSFTAEEVKSRLPNLPKYSPGILIPYFDLQGAVTEFYRFRYYDVSRNGWQDLSKRKEMRYAQESGSVNELYIPPLLKPGKTWEQAANDTNVPIVITEGEFKAAFGAKHGFFVLGLGGVSMAIVKGKLLGDFGRFEWEGRPVYIVFDSDAEEPEKWQIRKARAAVAEALANLGAKVRLGRVPALEADGKTGLDDLLLAKGAAALQAVLDDAEAYASELYRLNEEYVYVKSPATGVIVRLEDDEDMKVLDFIKHVASTRFINREHTYASGITVLKPESAAEAWVKWPHRRVVERITYAPGKERITDKNELNKWLGWGAEPKKGDIAPFRKLFDHLTTGLSREHKQWLLQWLAFPIKHPGAKLYSAVVIWSRQTGTGKTLIGSIMRKVYGEKNSIEISDSDLTGSFNEWAPNKQFVMGDEIAGGERKRDVADRLKNIITRDQINVNKKYVSQYRVPDTINYYFTSQHPDAFFMDDKDRRYFVHEGPSERLSPQEYAEIAAWMISPAGPAALLYYLMNDVDLTGFNPAAEAPKTAAKDQMQRDSRSELEDWVANLAETLSLKYCSTKELADRYNKDRKIAISPVTISKHLRARFKEWGANSSPAQAKPLKGICSNPNGARVWILSNDAEEVASLGAASQTQVYRQYKQEHERLADMQGDPMARLYL